MDSISVKNDKSFEELFEKFGKDGKACSGQSVKTTVVAITSDCVFLQLSGKSEGILDKTEVTKKTEQLRFRKATKSMSFSIKSAGRNAFTTRISGQSANDE